MGAGLSFRHSLKTFLFTHMNLQRIRDFFVIVGYTRLLFTFHWMTFLMQPMPHRMILKEEINLLCMVRVNCFIVQTFP